MAAQKAIIAGATGAVGNAIATRLASDPDTTVVGLSRRQPAVVVPGVNYVHVDLDNRDNCRNALEPHLDATHVFYCGRASHAEQTLENAAGNLRLLEHLIDTLEPGLLQHAHLVQGGKVYGVHIGPFPSPASEDDPRAPIENFNYVQEDFFARAQHSCELDLVSVPPEYAGALFTQQFTQPGFVHWCIRNLVQRTRRRIRLSRSRGRLPQHHPGDIVAIVGRRHGMDGNGQ